MVTNNNTTPKDPKAAAQQEADRNASGLVGEPQGERQFNWGEALVNTFTDHDSGGPDWTKVLLTVLGGIAGGIMGIDSGLGGILISGLIGTLVAGVGSAMLVPIARNEDPKAPHRPQTIKRSPALEPNSKVIEQVAVKLGNDAVSVPTYNPAENPAASTNPSMADPQLRTIIEQYRHIAASGNPFDDPVNSHLRTVLATLEKNENTREINLRYLRDTLPSALEGPATQVDAYLQRLDPQKRQALSVRLRGIDLSKVPGQQGSLGPELEQYGQQIKDQLLKELAARRGVTPNGVDVESQKAIEDLFNSWDHLNVVVKRDIISNFADEAIKDAMNQNVKDTRVFFPETETPVPIIGYWPSNWVPDMFRSDMEGRYRNAANKNPPDYETMATVLEQRIAQDDHMPQNQRLSDGVKQQMKTLAMGMHAKEEVRRLDAYIAGPLHKELEQLDQFETSLNDQRQRVMSLKQYLQGNAQTQTTNDQSSKTSESLPQHVLNQVQNMMGTNPLTASNQSPSGSAGPLPAKPQNPDANKNRPAVTL